VFAWRPAKEHSRFRLTVARDSGFGDVVLDVDGLSDPLYLPEKALAPGTHFWKWSVDNAESEVFRFTIDPDAVVLETPAADVWLERLPTGHPRIYLRPEDVPGLRASRLGERADLWQGLQAVCDELLAEPHTLAEPPYLPDRSRDYDAFFKAFCEIMWSARSFVAGAETLGLAHLISGDVRYARPAIERLVSVCKWDPYGASHIASNDEAHMPVIWHGPMACDWVWDQISERDREPIIEHFRQRGRVTFEHMHGRGSYGVTRFDSHAGREIVFLAMTALAFHEHIPEARTWLEWLRPVLCGIWPVWAGDDGGWAEGPSYGLAYVRIMTMFALALKRGAGVDLFRRPFWRGHARWRQWCFPPYAEWIGFGDHSERWKSTWLWNADLVDLIGRETGTGEFASYVAEQRREAELCAARPVRRLLSYNTQRFHFLPPAPPEPHPERAPMLQVFPGAGWAALRTDLEDASRDIAFIFRSSPYGAVSHSHANNNDFIMHVAGKAMVMPSGYYAGYGSPHHMHWVWHTKSHNCLTLSDAGQLMRSHDSRGAIEHPFEDERVVYLCGNADASYSDRALRCRRHVAFLKPHHCFVMIDEFQPRPDVASGLQWNLHSWNRFEVDEELRAFRVEREGSVLEGHFLHHLNSFFTLSEGWDPPPKSSKPSDQWYMQHHLRYCPADMPRAANLGVVLCPGHARLTPAPVETERVEATEIARIGDDLVLLSSQRGVEYADLRSDALALLHVQGVTYELTDAGLCRRDQ